MFSNKAWTGTRVPRNTQAPLTTSGFRSTAWQALQSNIATLYREHSFAANRIAARALIGAGDLAVVLVVLHHDDARGAEYERARGPGDERVHDRAEKRRPEPGDA